MSMEIDQETKDRYAKIARTRVCPDCGQDVEKTTLGDVMEKAGGKLEEGEEPDAVAFVCSHAECKYAISIGEKEAA